MGVYYTGSHYNLIIHYEMIFENSTLQKGKITSQVAETPAASIVLLNNIHFAWLNPMQLLSIHLRNIDKQIGASKSLALAGYDFTS